MDLETYFKGLMEYNYLNLTMDDTPSVMIHLLTPIKKKFNHYFTIVINGSFFARLDSFDGVVFNEIIKMYKDDNIKSLSKDKLTYYIRSGVEYATVLFDEDEDESADKINKITVMFDEIGRIALGHHLKKLFKKRPAYLYSKHHKKPYAVSFIEGGFNDKIDMLDILDNLYKKGVFYLEFDESFLANGEIKNYLQYKDCFFTSLIINKASISSKEAIELERLGLKQVVINVVSNKMETEYMITGRNIKDINNTIKACKNAHIKVVVRTEVTPRNEDYLPIMEHFHSIGVKSFSISVDPIMDNPDLVVKRAFYYANINALELALESNSVKENQLRLLDVNLDYMGKYITKFYMKKDSSLFLDKGLSVMLGDIKNNSLEECFTMKTAKKMRREYFKELK